MATKFCEGRKQTGSSAHTASRLKLIDAPEKSPA